MCVYSVNTGKIIPIIIISSPSWTSQDVGRWYGCGVCMDGVCVCSVWCMCGVCGMSIVRALCGACVGMHVCFHVCAHTSMSVVCMCAHACSVVCFVCVHQYSHYVSHMWMSVSFFTLSKLSLSSILTELVNSDNSLFSPLPSCFNQNLQYLLYTTGSSQYRLKKH